jgi:nucleoid-associated protein YgaU
MKRISILGVMLLVWLAPRGWAEDAATEERLNKLAGKVDDLTAGQDALRRQIESLSKEIESLREKAATPPVNYASHEDLRRVADAVKEVDRKRMEDADKVRTELLKLQKMLATPTPPTKKQAPTVEPSSSSKADTNDKGFDYVIKKGDTLSIIVKAYRDNNIKVTSDQILKANPGLKPERLTVGQKIWIPAPQ